MVPRLWLASIALASSILSCRSPSPTAPQAAAREDLAASVDPRVGTEGATAADAGNTFPGPAVPFGLVRLGPDAQEPNVNSGYRATGDVVGFSHLHVSGTGGGPKYGVILVVPTTGAVAPGDHASPRQDEAIRVGSYAVVLARWAVRAELSASARVGYHRYTFPETPRANVLIDVAHLLASSYEPETQRYLGGHVAFRSPREVRGYGRYRGGWNMGGEYRVHFCAVLDPSATPTETGTWSGDAVHPANAAEPDDGARVGAYVSMPARAGQVVELAVGISMASEERACASVHDPHAPQGYASAVRANVAAWNDVLGRVTVEGATPTEKTMLYSALYHAHLMPTDRTGDGAKWTSQEPYYDDFYTLWDTFRTQNPLLALLEPKREADLVRALVDVQRHEGFLPDGRTGDDNGRTQGGSDADIVLADAWAKKLPGIDWPAAYEAMKKDAEVPPRDPSKEGRGGLAGWHALGYVPAEEERSGSRTVEYAYDDFCIAEVAAGLGKTDDAARYRQRANGWARLWDDRVVDAGVHGFVRPRGADGSFKTPFDPRGKGSWKDDFYEDSSWSYSLFVPHDVRALVARAGGDDAFVRRLDALFEQGLFEINDEPAFLHPYLYLWAGRPDRTALRVHETLTRRFHPGPTGLPGNDDAGAMSAWYVWSAIGLFPNAGQDVYLLGTPSLPRVVLHLDGGRDVVIVAEGLDRGRTRFYVQGVTVNGAAWDKPWIRHADLVAGATIVFRMGEAPSAWGRGARPPSASDP